MTRTIHGVTLADWISRYPLIRDLVDTRPVTWTNPGLQAADLALLEVGMTAADIDDAADRLRRFAPYLAQAFPDTRPSGGIIIESPLVAVPNLQQRLADRHRATFPASCGSNSIAGCPFPGQLRPAAASTKCSNTPRILP